MDHTIAEIAGAMVFRIKLHAHDRQGFMLDSFNGIVIKIYMGYFKILRELTYMVAMVLGAGANLAT